MVAADCSMGGYQLRKCASSRRPPVKKPPKRKVAKRVAREVEENTPEAQGADAPGTQKITRSGRPYGGKGLVYGTEKVGQGFGKHPMGAVHYFKDRAKGEGFGDAKAPHGMPKIPLQNLSSLQMSKLRNGKPVRVSLGTGCDGDCSCAMKEGTLKKIMKNKRGKTTIKLDADELAENKMSGTGIMKGARGKLGGPRHGGIIDGGLAVTKGDCTTYYDGMMNKTKTECKGDALPKKRGPPPKGQRIVALAKKSAGGAIKIGRAKYGTPSVDRAKHNITGKGFSAPTPAMWNNAIRQFEEAQKRGDQAKMEQYEKILEGYEDITKKVASSASLKPTKSSLNSLMKIHDIVEDDHSGILGYILTPEFEDSLKKSIEHIASKVGMKPAFGKGITYGDGGSIGYGGALGHPDRVGTRVGGAIGRTASSSSVTNVGAGGNILGPMQASKAPQAASQNFFFHTQFPPAMAQEITGGGAGSFTLSPKGKKHGRGIIY